MSGSTGGDAPEQEQRSAPTPGELRWKEMVARLAGRTGMSPLDVEAATEGRIRASEIADLIDSVAQPPDAGATDEGIAPTGEAASADSEQEA